MMINGIVDSHAHYDDEAFDPDREEVISALPSGGIELVINPGCDLATSRAAVEFSEKYPYFYAMVGLHPQSADEFTDSTIDTLRELARSPKVVGIGEIGLDYHYDDVAPAQKQKEVLALQMELARSLDLPVCIHDRDAHADTLEMLASYPDVRGVIHCYSGSAEMAKELIRRGWCLGFTGAITFKNARRALESIAVCPDDRILMETDSPYLAPTPHRGKRCDSRLLPLVAEKIAEVRGITAQQAVDITAANAKRLYNIK
jgi:TatD DNase family protein